MVQGVRDKKAQEDWNMLSQQPVKQALNTKEDKPYAV